MRQSDRSSERGQARRGGQRGTGGGRGVSASEATADALPFTLLYFKEPQQGFNRVT